MICLTSYRYRKWLLLAFVLALAVAARLILLSFTGGARVNSGDFQLSIARQIIEHRGILYTIGNEGGIETPLDRPPLWGTLLALGLWLLRDEYAAVVSLQLLLCVGYVSVTFLLTNRLFGSLRTATLAATILSLYPQYVMHSASAADRSLQTLLVLSIVYLLWRVDEDLDLRKVVAIGILCGLELLTRSLMVFALPLTLLWLCAPRAQRLRRLGIASAIALTTALTISPWLLHTKHILGAYRMTSHAGHMLWVSNNPEFDNCDYPVYTIDHCNEFASRALGPTVSKELLSLAPVSRDERFRELAMDYIRTHWKETMARAVVKVDAAFSPAFNPRRRIDGVWNLGATKALAYTIPYVLILVFGGLGVLQSLRATRRFVTLVVCVFLAVAMFASAFWAHSVEKLNVLLYLIIFAAQGMDAFARVVKPGFAVLLPETVANSKSHTGR